MTDEQLLGATIEVHQRQIHSELADTN